MPDDVLVESSPTATEPGDFREYLALKSADKPEKSAAATDEVESGSEPAPDDKKDKETPESGKLTPEQRATRDRERNERRWTKLNRTLGEERSERKRLEAELDALRRERAAESSPARPLIEGKPKLSEFVNQIGEGKKYSSYEDAEEAYQDARDSFNKKQLRAEWEAEQSETRNKETATAIYKTYNGKIKTFGEANEDFHESFEAVTDVIAESLGERNPVSTAIVQAEHPGEIIDYLAKNPEDFDKLLELPFNRAVMRIGAIDARFDKSAESPKPKTDEEAPRATRTVRARGESPNVVQGMSKAAESGNFRDFKAQKHSARKAGNRF